MFHRILHNAYILYQKNTSDNPVKSRVKFLQSIVEDLSSGDMQPNRRRRIRQINRGVVNLPVGKKRIVTFVRIGDEEVNDGAVEQHVHNVEEGYTENVPGFIKNAERNKKLWFELAAIM